jgi:predicted Zn finger-like uncharacterized protein
MIIACQNCNKKFDIDQILISVKGRLLQCNSCNHKWFFRREKAVQIIDSPLDKNMEVFESNKSQENDPKDNNNRDTVQEKITLPTEEKNKKIEINKIKIKKQSNLLNLIIVFIISFIALILLVDTFKVPLGKIFPNLEFFLYSLYETIKDVILFFNDLI